MQKRKGLITKQTLERLYWKEKLSTFDIADILNCSACTVINRMKEFRIKRRRVGLRKINISKESLYKLYIGKGFSTRQIAKICHCEQTAILNRLRQFNIPIRYPKAKIAVTEQRLRDLYIRQGLSIYKIARKYDCAYSTIHRYLKLYKIPIRPLKTVNISKSTLENLYLRKKLSILRIAKICYCSPITISEKIKKYGILRRPSWENLVKHARVDFNGNQSFKAYMIGFRLGDLGVRKGIHFIKIGCGTTKKAQIDLIKDVFGPYGPIWISKRNIAGAVHIDSSLNLSFKFLLRKHEMIPRWILSNKKYFLSFLAGYTDAEGNISISQGKAKFRIRSYDKGILQGIHYKLHSLGISSLFSLDRKAGTDKRGVLHNKDCWRVVVNKRESLLQLFSYLKPLMHHKKRKKDLIKSLKNVESRLNN